LLSSSQQCKYDGEDVYCCDYYGNNCELNLPKEEEPAPFLLPVVNNEVVEPLPDLKTHTVFYLPPTTDDPNPSRKRQVQAKNFITARRVVQVKQQVPAAQVKRQTAAQVKPQQSQNYRVVKRS
jgi:hypothetical protein